MMSKYVNEWLVSIDIYSDYLPLEMISRELGLEPDPDSSHEKGSIAPRGRVREKTCWSFESSLPQTAPLDRHIREVLDALPPERLRIATEKLGCEAELRVGVLYRTVTCTIELSPDIVRLLAGYDGLGFSATTYPCGDEPSDAAP